MPTATISNAKLIKNIAHCFRPLFDTIDLTMSPDGLSINQISRDSKVLCSMTLDKSDISLNCSKRITSRIDMAQFYQTCKSIKKLDSITFTMHAPHPDVLLTLTNAFGTREFVLPGSTIHSVPPCNILQRYGAGVSVPSLALHRTSVDLKSVGETASLEMEDGSLVFQIAALTIRLTVPQEPTAPETSLRFATQSLKTISRLFSVNEEATVYLQEGLPLVVSYSLFPEGPSVCIFGFKSEE